MPRIRGVLLREGTPLQGSARVLLRLLQGQHHTRLFHSAGYKADRGVGIRVVLGQAQAGFRHGCPVQEAAVPRGRRVSPRKKFPVIICFLSGFGFC